MLMTSLLRDVARSLVKQRRFDRLLERTVARAAGWDDAAAVRGLARDSLGRIVDAAPVPLRKGAPDLVALKSRDARRVAAMLADLPRDGAEALALAAAIASVDPRDETAFTAWLATFWLVHRDTIEALRPLRGRDIALHMGCRPRLARAQASVASFAALPALAHVVLVGNGHACDYRFADGVLEVPAGDGYEQLPAKMAAGLAMLAIACPPRALVKLDDDHRLADATALQGLLDDCGRTRRPLQTGHVYSTPYPSGHNRGWHYGKCPEHAGNFRPLAFPTPTAWASGEYGYLLNGPALRRFPWAWLNYRDWLRDILYEDIAVGEIGARLGIRVQHAALERAVSAWPSY